MREENLRKRDVRVLIVVLMLLLFVLVLRNCGRPDNANNSSISASIQIDNRVKTDKGSTISNTSSALEKREVLFTGIPSSVINKSTKVHLDNNELNDDIYLKYKVINKDTEEVLFETDLIPSGQFVEWIPGDSGLHEGKNNILFVETPYILIDEEWVTLTVGKNEAVFTFVK